MMKIKKGLDLPIKGEPKELIDGTKSIDSVALLTDDFIGIRPKLSVKEADRVNKGQLLFTDNNNERVKFTAPASGVIQALHYSDHGLLQAVVIRLEGDDQQSFDSFPAQQLSSLSREQVVEQLLESGLWTGFRARPFNKVANPDDQAHSIFVTAMDTNPLAPCINKILQEQEIDFANGVEVIAKLTKGKVYVCKAQSTQLADFAQSNILVENFSGPHPAGNVGTHIHFLDPVHRTKTVWHIGLQDVIAIGRLFTSGRLDSERIISLAGPGVKKPRLIKTLTGAAIDDLTDGELNEGEQRVISGSVLSGRHSTGSNQFLGRYHQQISVLPEQRKREFLGWLNPGLNRYSYKNIVLSRFIPGKKFAFDTSTHGEVRAIIPTGSYERVMPLDIMPTFLLRALAVNDLEEAEDLGCLELDEEDLALCAFVCPSKQEFGPMLRYALQQIEQEG